MSVEVERLAQEIADEPHYYGLFVYRRNPCCYADKIEVGMGGVFHDHYDDAERAVHLMKAMARAVEILIDRFHQHGEIETTMGPCEGCEVPVA